MTIDVLPVVLYLTEPIVPLIRLAAIVDVLPVVHYLTEPIGAGESNAPSISSSLTTNNSECKQRKHSPIMCNQVIIEVTYTNVNIRVALINKLLK